MTKVGITPIRNAQQVDLAVRKRYAVADLLAAQGDLQSAREQINQAVNDYYLDRQNKIEAQKMQLDFVNKRLEEAGVQKNSAINFALKERERILNKQEKQLEREREDKKIIQNIALEARKNGANDSVIEAITNSKDPAEAIRNAGNSLRDPLAELKRMQLLESIKTSRANRALA